MHRKLKQVFPKNLKSLRKLEAAGAKVELSKLNLKTNYYEIFCNKLINGIIFTQKSIRKSFGKLVEGLSIPNLIEVQKNSYQEFLSSKALNEQMDILSKGIDRVFKSIFPIDDSSDKSTLEYISYKLEKPKFDVLECKQRSLTYSASLKANLRLVVYDIDTENNTKQILSAKEQEVFIGELPLMTPSGTFVVNGVERVVVNQMHRSPEYF